MLALHYICVVKEKEKKPFKDRLLNKYRLVVLNEDTYEEKLSYKLNKLNIFLLIALVSATLIVLTVGLIAFTSVKEYITGSVSYTHLTLPTILLV